MSDFGMDLIDDVPLEQSDPLGVLQLRATPPPRPSEAPVYEPEEILEEMVAAQSLARRPEFFGEGYTVTPSPGFRSPPLPTEAPDAEGAPRSHTPSAGCPGGGRGPARARAAAPAGRTSRSLPLPLVPRLAAVINELARVAVAWGCAR